MIRALPLCGRQAYRLARTASCRKPPSILAACYLPTPVSPAMVNWLAQAATSRNWPLPTARPGIWGGTASRFPGIRRPYGTWPGPRPCSGTAGQNHSRRKRRGRLKTRKRWPAICPVRPAALWPSQRWRRCLPRPFRLIQRLAVHRSSRRSRPMNGASFHLSPGLTVL